MARSTIRRQAAMDVTRMRARGGAGAQSYAARHVSIQAELEGLAALIMRWHRAEVKEWPGMLLSRRRRQCHEAGALFLPLSASLAAAFHGPQDPQEPADCAATGDAAQSEAAAQAAAQAAAHGIVRDFVEGGSLGDYEARLEVIRTVLRVVRSRFVLFAAVPGGAEAEASESAEGNAAGARRAAGGGGKDARAAVALCDVAGNALLFYSQFSGVVAAALAERAGPIEQGLKDLVKICKWENRDYAAMRANMDRSHRQLHKLLRKYEEALRCSVKLTFQRIMEGAIAKFWASDRPLICARPAAAPVLDKPRKAPKRAKSKAAAAAAAAGGGADAGLEKWDGAVLESVAHARAVFEGLRDAKATAEGRGPGKRKVKRAERGDSSDVLAQLGGEVAAALGRQAGEGRVAVNDLDADEVEAAAVEILEQANELKETGAIKTIKKRALVSCLAFLADLGLSYHASAVPSHRRGLETLLCGPLPQDELEDPSQGGQDRRPGAYFFRCVLLLRKLREGSAAASKDLSQGEVHRAVGLCEHLMHLTAAQRESLVVFRQQAERLAAVHAAVAAPLGGAKGRLGLPPQTGARALLQGVKRLAAQLGLEVQQAEMLHAALRRVAGEAYRRADAQERCLAGLGGAVDALEAAVAGLHVPGPDVAACSDAAAGVDGGDVVGAWLVSWAQMEAADGALAALAEAMRGGLGVLETEPEGSGRDDDHQPDTVHVVLSSLLRSFCGRAAELREAAARCRSSAPTADGAGACGVTSRDVEALRKGLREAMDGMREAVSSATAALCEGIMRQPAPADDEPCSSSAAGHSAGQGEECDENTAGPGRTTDEEGGMERAALSVVKQHAHLAQLLAPSRIRGVTVQLLAACALVSRFADASDPADDDAQQALSLAAEQLHGMAPAVAAVVGLARATGQVGARFHKACTKLALVLLGVFNEVVANGFCRPDEKEGEEGDMIDGVEGMGMGEGEGQKNVSDEIEDEEQLVGADQEGAEKAEGKQQEREKNEKSVEMRQDFDGELEDVDKEEEEEEEDKEEEEEDKEDVDREMGEVGSDEEQVLDERAGDKDLEDEEEQEKDSKYEKDNPLQGQEDKMDAEMRGKEEEEEEDGKDGKEKRDDGKDKRGLDKEEADKAGEEGEDGSSESGEEGGQEAEQVEESHGVDAAGPQTEVEEGGDELPEDMKLDEEGGEEGAEEEGGEEEGGDGEEEMQDEGGSGDKDVAPPETEEGDAEDELAGDVQQAGAEEPASEDADADAAMDPEGGADRDVSDAAAQASDAGRSSRGAAARETAGGSSAQAAADDAQAAADDGGQKGVVGAQAMAGGERGAEEEGREEEEDGGKAGRRRQEANMLRSLGELVKEELKREARDRAEGEEAREKKAAGDEEGQRGEAKEYEFVEEKEAADGVATGAATDEQMAEQQQGDENGPDAAEDEGGEGDGGEEDKKREGSKGEEGAQRDRDKSWRFGVDKKQAAMDKGDDEKEEEEEGRDAMDGVELSAEEEDARRQRDAERQREVSEAVRTRRRGPDADAVMEDAEAEAAGDDEHRGDGGAAGKAAERRPGEGREAELEAVESEGAWGRLVQRVEGSARELCEQLRLVLAPTLATKLKGDFQSGKRINLKRIIPYIASQFKRDKIWMRRTCPVKRTYQAIPHPPPPQWPRRRRPHMQASCCCVCAGVARPVVGNIGELRRPPSRGLRCTHTRPTGASKVHRGVHC